MSRTAKILTKELKEIAIKNGVSIPTVYGRIRRGWDELEAVNTPPSSSYDFVKNLPRSEDGFLIANIRPKSENSYSFNLYEDDEERFLKAVDDSGLSRSDFIRQCVEYYLDNVWKKTTTTIT